MPRGAMLEPPKSLDAAAVLSKKQKASKELHNKLESVNNEIMAMEARMRATNPGADRTSNRPRQQQ